MFGASASPGFGQQPSPGFGTGSIFGAASTQAQQGGIFGNTLSSPNLFGQASQQPQQQQQMMVPAQPLSKSLFSAAILKSAECYFDR
jgi:hypothetical protein